MCDRKIVSLFLLKFFWGEYGDIFSKKFAFTLADLQSSVCPCVAQDH